MNLQSLQIPLADFVINANSYQGILVIMFIGICLAAVYAYYNKSVLGRFIRGLIAAEAFSHETAKTPEEIEFDNDKLIKSSIRRDSTFKRYIKTVDGRYYILPEHAEMMKKRYDDKNTDLRAVFITIGLCGILAVLLWFLLPELFNYMNSIFNVNQ